MDRREFLEIDPRLLRLPPSRSQGADPFKLQTQIARFARSTTGMPDLEVYRGSDGELMISNGVTRATRIAKLLPGTTVRVEVLDDLPRPFGQLPTGQGPITMSNPLRRDVLQALDELGEIFPDWRFGQMIANLAVIARGPTQAAVWDMEDDELLAATRRLLDKHKDRAATLAQSG